MKNPPVCIIIISLVSKYINGNANYDKICFEGVRVKTEKGKEGQIKTDRQIQI